MKREFLEGLDLGEGVKLPLQEGKLLGLEDFAKTCRETDPDAFLPEIVPAEFGGTLTA